MMGSNVNKILLQTVTIFRPRCGLHYPINLNAINKNHDAAKAGETSLNLNRD